MTGATGNIGRMVVDHLVAGDEAVAEMQVAMGDEAERYVDTILAGSVDNPVEANTVVEDVTGHRPTRFAAWASANAAAFRG